MLQLLARCSMAGHGLTKSNWAAFVCDFLKPKMGSKNCQGRARGVWAGGLEVALRVINKVFVGWELCFAQNVAHFAALLFLLLLFNHPKRWFLSSFYLAAIWAAQRFSFSCLCFLCLSVAPCFSRIFSFCSPALFVVERYIFSYPCKGYSNLITTFVSQADFLSIFGIYKRVYTDRPTDWLENNAQTKTNLKFVLKLSFGSKG